MDPLVSTVFSFCFPVSCLVFSCASYRCVRGVHISLYPNSSIPQFPFILKRVHWYTGTMVHCFVFNFGPTLSAVLYDHFLIELVAIIYINAHLVLRIIFWKESSRKAPCREESCCTTQCLPVYFAVVPFVLLCSYMYYYML